MARAMTLESSELKFLKLDDNHPTTKNYLSELPRIKLDQSVSAFVLRRRHGISGGSECLHQPIPRMKRRGAISYDVTDSSAVYIRLLARRVSSNRMSRRGSLQSIAPSQRFRNVSVLQAIGVEEQHKTLQGGLRNIDSWDFDIFAFESVTEGRPLFYMGLYLFHHLGLIDTLKLDIMKLRKFLTLVEGCYHPENSYHNCTHAADVTQALHCLLSDSSMYKMMKPTEVLASLVAAICHDMDHPGVNQNYLVNTSSYLAAIHGKCSVLERHHCNSSKAILRQSELLSHLSINDREEIVSLIEDMILATDVSRHKEFMTSFEELILSERVLDTSIDKCRFVLQMVIKCADISNPARKLVLSKQWSELIMEEFFRQGDKEKQLNLPISYLCDRYITTIPKSQSDFFAFVALPLFKAWSQFVKSPLSMHLCTNISNNKSYWDDLVTMS